jgi:hypothetical protein
MGMTQDLSRPGVHPAFIVWASSIIGWSRLWVAQKYHFLRNAVAVWAEGCS